MRGRIDSVNAYVCELKREGLLPTNRQGKEGGNERDAIKDGDRDGSIGCTLDTQSTLQTGL